MQGEIGIEITYPQGIFALSGRIRQRKRDTKCRNLRKSLARDDNTSAYE
jgi:hypothetical protein